VRTSHGAQSEIVGLFLAQGVAALDLAARLEAELDPRQLLQERSVLLAGPTRRSFASRSPSTSTIVVAAI
jgi:hypothetical protein